MTWGSLAEVCDNVGIMYAGRIVECGTLADIFDDLRHPYTQGLFDSPAGHREPARGAQTDPRA